MRTGIIYILLWLSLGQRGGEDRESGKKPARQHCALGDNKGLDIDAEWRPASGRQVKAVAHFVFMVSSAPHESQLSKPAHRERRERQIK